MPPNLMELVQRHRDRIRSGDNSVIVRAADGTTVTGPINIDGGPFLIDGAPYNPMTDPEDLIKGGVGGVPERLPKGAGDTYLRVNPMTNLLEWVALPVDPGFANPMTTPWDLIRGGAAGAPTRLAKGAAGTYLGVNGSGDLTYSVPIGFANPMTDPDDLIVGGVAGAAARLGKGANSRVFGVNAAGVLGYHQVTNGMLGTGVVSEDKLAANAVHGARVFANHTGGAVAATGGWQTVPGSTLGVLTTGASIPPAVWAGAVLQVSASVNGTVMSAYIAINGTPSILVGTFTMTAPGWNYTFSAAVPLVLAAATGYTFSVQYVANAGTITFSTGYTYAQEAKR